MKHLTFPKEMLEAMSGQSDVTSWPFVRCLCFFCVLQIEDLLCIRSLYTKGQDVTSQSDVSSPICYCGFSSHYILKGCMAYKSQICHKGSVRCLTWHLTLSKKVSRAMLNLRFVSQWDVYLLAFFFTTFVYWFSPSCSKLTKFMANHFFSNFNINKSFSVVNGKTCINIFW